VEDAFPERELKVVGRRAMENALLDAG